MRKEKGQQQDPGEHKHLKNLSEENEPMTGNENETKIKLEEPWKCDALGTEENFKKNMFNIMSNASKPLFKTMSEN